MNRIELIQKTAITYRIMIDGEIEPGAHVQLDPQAGVWVAHCEALGMAWEGFDSKAGAVSAIESALEESNVEALQDYYGSPMPKGVVVVEAKG